ncbi:hypothetical protein [Thalassotalea ganghwensis]
MESIKKHFYPHHSNSEYCLVVNDHYVYKYFYQSKSLKKYFRIPAGSNSLAGKLKDFIARHMIRYFSSKMGLGHVIELPNKVVIVIYDKIYRFDPNTMQNFAEPVYSLKANSILPPLRNGIAVCPSNNVYFAEYANVKGRDTRILAITNDGTQVSCAFTFSGKKIKHAHGIYWDKFRQRIWVTTGDSDTESNFYYTDDEFKTLQHFAGGDQTWRAVSLMFFENSIAWGMDAGKDAQEEDINYIYSLSLPSKKRTKVQRIDAPAYHAVSTASGYYYLGVNYEPGCKQKIAPQAAIWFTKDGISWQKLKSLSYQSSPSINGSKYAYIYLPSGIIPDDLCLYNATNVGSESGLMFTISKPLA